MVARTNTEAPVRALPHEARSIDPFNLVVGILTAFFLGGFAFAPGPLGLFCLAAALVLGMALPLAGMVAIAIAITTLPLVGMGVDLADVRPDELMMIAVIAATGLRALIKRDIPRSEVTVPVIVFVSVAAASMLFRVVVTGYAIPFLSVLFPLAKHVLRLLLMLAVAWLASRRKGGLATIAVALAIGAALGAIFGIAQSVYAPVEDFLLAFYPSIRGGAVHLFWGQRAFAAFDGNPNHLSAGMLILSMNALAIASAEEDITRRRWWWVAGTVPLLAIVASASRATGLVAIIVLSVLWLRGKNALYRDALVAMVGYLALVPNLLRTRILQLIIVSNGHLSEESDILKKWMAWTNPFSRRETLLMTDNFYIDTVVNFWPLALVAFLWLMWVIYRRLRNEGRMNALDPGMIAGARVSFISISILSLNGSFFSVPRVSEILWMLLGLAWGWFELRTRLGLPGPDGMCEPGVVGGTETSPALD